MFNVQIKSTHETDVGAQILAELSANEAILGSEIVESLKEDAEYLQTLRARVLGEQLSDLEAYMVALSSVTKKFDLPSSKFAWSNSLGPSKALVQGTGLWFEYLNVAYNVAAKMTNMIKCDSVSYRKAAGVFHFARVSIFPRVNAEVPLELSNDVLMFLERLCLARALDLSSTDRSTKWAASSFYAQLLIDINSLPIDLIGFREDLFDRLRVLQAEALMAVAEDLRYSRRRVDQLLARDALLKCIEISASDKSIIDTAQKVLEQPLNRRSTQSLANLNGENEIPIESQFTSVQAPDIIPWSPKGQALFKELLPMNLIYLPLLLKSSLDQRVRSQISSKLQLVNHDIRTAAVNYNLPVCIEVIQDPGRLPQSLLAFKESIPDISGLLHECRSLMAKLEADSSSHEEMIKTQISSARASARSIASRYEDVEYLLRVLQDEDSLAKFLGYTKLRTTDRASKPFFLTRVEETYGKISRGLDSRSALQKKVLEKLDELPINETIEEYFKIHENTQPGVCFAEVLPQLWSNFTQYLTQVEESSRKSQNQLSVLQDLHKSSESIRKMSVVDPKRIRAAQALFAAWSVSIDLETDCQSLLHNLATLDLSRRLLPNTHRAPPPLASSPLATIPQSQFSWTPGSAINIV